MTESTVYFPSSPTTTAEANRSEKTPTPELDTVGLKRGNRKHQLRHIPTAWVPGEKKIKNNDIKEAGEPEPEKYGGSPGGLPSDETLVVKSA